MMITHDALTLGFPLWLRVAHWVNFLFLTMLMRSGIQILADHPMLYLNTHCTPGTEWIRFSRKKSHPKDRAWTSMDEAVDVSPIIAMPGGRHHLGMGRHWHFFSVFFWLLNGLIYITLLFLTPNWHRLIPTQWDIIPHAWHTFLIYSHFHIPPASDFHPYDPLQQLAYASVVFILAPLAILTGIAMSPTIGAHWPWYPRLFGDRQIARSLHFLIMAAYVIFLAIHVSLVFIVHFRQNMLSMVLGQAHGNATLAIWIGAGIVTFVLLLQVFLSWYSLKQPRMIQHATGKLVDPLMGLLKETTSRQEYDHADISPYFWVNGERPDVPEWRSLCQNDFADWKIKISGLVKEPLQLSLQDLQAMPKRTQVTEHICIQGWSSFGEWTGVYVGDILDRCQPLPSARYIIFYSYQQDQDGKVYYGSLSLDEARHPQTILAYEMNGEALPLDHGAPLRLRIETKLGFKMVKWLRAIELVEDFRTIGEGQGGYREDTQYYGTGAEI